MRQASKPGLLKKPAAKLKDERIYTPEEGRAAYLRFMAKASKLPGAEAAYQRIKERHQLAVGISKMREHARLTQTEVSRRMRDPQPTLCKVWVKARLSNWRGRSDPPRQFRDAEPQRTKQRTKSVAKSVQTA